MDLKKLLGDAYVEGMTLEEVDEALKGRKLIDPETLPKSVNKDQFDKVASELAAAKRQLKEIENQSLTEEQRLKQEMEARESQIVDLKRELMRGSAREKLAQAGIPNVNFLDDLLGDFNVNDPVKFDKAIDNIVGTIAEMATAREKQVRKELLKGTPKPPPAEPDDEIKRWSDMTTTEKMALKASDIKEFNRLEALASNQTP